jgi:Zn-dependent protease with chaperone function
MTQIVAPAARRLPRGLRHPAEIPLYVLMVIINVAIVVAALRLIVIINWIPAFLHTPAIDVVARALLGAILLYIPGLVIYREAMRAGTSANTVQLSESQYPEIFATMRRYAAQLGIKKVPDLFLQNGNGVLNAFAAQAFRQNYVVIYNSLFANLQRESQAALDFILGHELGHIKLGHVSLWYQISIAYSGQIPIIGAWLSRLREYSCDRYGAYLEPEGQVGMVLLASGRYTEQKVDVPSLLEQSERTRGFWVAVTEIPHLHPWTLSRLRALYRLGLFKRTRHAA